MLGKGDMRQTRCSQEGRQNKTYKVKPTLVESKF